MIPLICENASKRRADGGVDVIIEEVSDSKSLDFPRVEILKSQMYRCCVWYIEKRTTFLRVSVIDALLTARKYPFMCSL